jgi:hypothetical protein
VSIAEVSKLPQNYIGKYKRLGKRSNLTEAAKIRQAKDPYERDRLPTESA